MTQCVRYLFVLLACTVVAVGEPMTARSATTPTASCVELEAWARAYAGTQPTLDDLARFDRGQRIAIFNVVTPNVRAALVREQLQRLSHRADLSTTQRVLLSEGQTLITPALYDRDSSAVEAFGEFWTRANPAFTTPEHVRAWYDLGAVTPSGEVIVKMARGINCNCKLGGADCQSGSCQASACSWQPNGCGSAFLSPCNGRCP